MTRQFFAAFLLLFSSYFWAGCDKEDFADTGSREELSITSSFTNDTYPIYVYLPSNYSTSVSCQLIIGLDGDFRFNTLAELVAAKVQTGSMPPAVLVGIGNNKERNRDYTPTAYAHGTGGGSNFYAFIVQELIPNLEAQFSIDTSNNKTLIGHSFGGLFTQYAMAQDRQTNPFDKFISNGTSYWYDEGVIFEYEAAYADTHSDLAVRFYNGMGSLEGGVLLASFAEMNDRLDGRGFPNFQHQSELITNSGHSGSVYETFKKGLDYVFSN